MLQPLLDATFKMLTLITFSHLMIQVPVTWLSRDNTSNGLAHPNRSFVGTLGNIAPITYGPFYRCERHLRPQRQPYRASRRLRNNGTFVSADHFAVFGDAPFRAGNGRCDVIHICLLVRAALLLY